MVAGHHLWHGGRLPGAQDTFVRTGKPDLPLIYADKTLIGVGKFKTVTAEELRKYAEVRGLIKSSITLSCAGTSGRSFLIFGSTGGLCFWGPFAFCSRME